jgi:hypothetical protein
MSIGSSFWRNSQQSRDHWNHQRDDYTMVNMMELLAAEHTDELQDDGQLDYDS